MQFEDVLGDERLWAVVYENGQKNILEQVFEQWKDLDFLEQFFQENYQDLTTNFHVVNVDDAIFQTIDDAHVMKCLILDIRPDSNLDRLFRPLENSRYREATLSKEKAKGKRIADHPSWLRLYALKFEPNTYLITGGAIKLTKTMEEREHTLRELLKMESVRRYLLENGVVDKDGLIDLLS